MRKYLSILILGFIGLLIITWPKSDTDSSNGQTGSADPDPNWDVPRHIAGGNTEVQILEWAENWEQTSAHPQQRQQILSSLKKYRSKRLELMREDPQAFLNTTFSINSYASLPDEFKPYVGRPYSAVGNMNVQWATSRKASGKLVCTHQNLFQSADETFEVIEIGGKYFPPSEKQAVNGIALENQLLVTTETVRQLESSEVAAAKNLFPEGNPDGIDPLTGQTNPGTYTLVGGKVVAFSSPDILEEVEQRLSSGEVSFINRLSGDQGGDQSTGSIQATPYQENQIDVLFIRVDFSDLPGEPVTQTDLETTLASVDTHLDAYSYGDAGITYTVSDTYYRMPSTASSYATTGDNAGIQTDARALAAADYTLSNYDVIAVYFPKLSDLSGSLITYGGLANIGATQDTASHWVNGVNSVQVILHEFGHNYGLYHANYHHPEQQLAGTYQVTGNLEYGDIFDTMGNGDAPEAHFNPLAKNQLQWIPDSKIAEATADGTWRIYRFDTYNARSNSILALKVPMAGDINYWVGYRQLYTSSSYNLSNAAYVVGENMAQNRETSLIDMTPESQASETDDREDAGLPVGSSYYDSAAGVTFETMAAGGSEPNQWIDVNISFDPRVALQDSLLEVDEQIGNAQIVLKRFFQSSGTLSIDYASSDGTATAPDDYYAVSGTVTWADGDSTDKIINIPIRPDLINEGIEDFTLTLSNPVGGVLDAQRSTLTVSILDPGQRYTTFTPPFFNQTINSLIPLENGQVIIGGNINAGIGDFDSIRHIARLNADGSVDSSFSSGSGFNDVVNVILRQNDGKLLAAGDFTQYNGTPCPGLARLSADGILDSSFMTNLGTGANGEILALTQENDGGILLGGDFSSFNGNAAEGLIRLNADGSRNTSSPLTLPFDTGWDTEIHCILVEDDGKIMVGGSLTIGWTGSGFKSGIARLNNSGTEDLSFNSDAGAHANGSTGTLSRVYSIQKQNDGKYLIAGQFTAYDENAAQYIARITNAGAFDATFNAPTFDQPITNGLIQANDRYIVTGNFLTPAKGIEGLTTTGNSDNTFYQQDGISFNAANPNIVRVFALSEDVEGQLFVGGNFFSYQGITTRPVIRIAGGVSPYQLWVRENFTAAQITAGISDPEDDPDSDNITNLAELAMGTDPNVMDAESLFSVNAGNGIEIVEDGGQQYLQISLAKPADPGSAWYAAQFSGDLQTWTPASPTPGSAEIVIIENSSTTFTVRDTVPISPSNPRFGRIVLQAAE